MLQNPIHLRPGEAGKLAACHFYGLPCASVCTLTTPCFCEQTEFGDGQLYRRILDLIGKR